MHTPSHSMPRRLSSDLKRCALAVGLALLAGCAQQQAQGYYDPQRGNSITDSQYTGQGSQYRNVVRAPSQVQVSWDRNGQTPVRTDEAAAPQPVGPTGSTPATAQSVQTATASTPAATVNPALTQFAPQAQTYAGTLPCLGRGMNCSGQQVVLTLAPNGRWRARMTFVDLAGVAGEPRVEQGCWDATTSRPIRLMLTDIKGNDRADFESVNNALRVRSMDGQTPNLNYSLTRQPDLDPIDEAPSASSNCG